MSDKQILDLYKQSPKHGKITLYCKDKVETKNMIKSLGVHYKLKDYQVIDYLLRKEIEKSR